MIFNTLITALKSELNDTSTATSTRLVRWLNDVHRTMCMHRKWPFLIVEESDTMTVGSSDVPYPVSSITFDTAVAHGVSWYPDEILNVWDVTDSVQSLEKITLARLRDKLQTTLTESGDPLFWYYAKQERADATVGNATKRYLNFFPVIDSDRSLVFRFTRKPTEYVSGSTAVLLIPDEWQPVVFEGVLAKAWRQRGDDRWLDAKDNYENGLKKMEKHYAEQMITGYNPSITSLRTRFPQVVTA